MKIYRDSKTWSVHNIIIKVQRVDYLLTVNVMSIQFKVIRLN